MIEFIKAIYDIVVSNNKFLVSLEQRIINIENAVTTQEKPQTDNQQSE